MLDIADAQKLLHCDERNRDVVKPFLNGQDLTEDPTQAASRWVIDFGDWPIERARSYEAPFALLEKHVRGDVQNKVGYPGWADRWWQYWRPRRELTTAIRELRRVLVFPQTSKTMLPVFVAIRMVYSHAVVVLAYDDYGHFGLLSSAFHLWWVIKHGSTLETRLRYTPTDVFETFTRPKPQSRQLWERIELEGGRLDEFRADLMIRTNLGLTKTYNRVHDPNARDPDIERLRELHVELDHAVRDAYGWTDLQLDHHHWETPQGMRFTVAPAAKDELLDRLLELNHQRYAEELAAGLHDKKGGKSPRRGKPTAQQQKVLL